MHEHIAITNVGRLAHDFIDGDSSIVTPLDFNFEKHGYTLLVVTPPSNYRCADSDYNAVFDDFRLVSSFFGVESLADVREDEFVRAIPDLRPPFMTGQ